MASRNRSVVSATPGGGAFAPIYLGDNGGRLIAFDVSDAAAPAFLSDVMLARNHWWNFSRGLYGQQPRLPKPSEHFRLAADL